MILRYKYSWLFLTLVLLMSGIAHGLETLPEPTGASAPAAASKGPPDEPNPSGFIEKMEYNLQKAIQEERIATLAELDKERRATLLYLTHERLAATDDLRSELNRLAAALLSERQATLAEIEAIGDRLVGRAIVRSKSLIDHFFVRLLQLLVFIGVTGAVTLFLFKRLCEKKRQKILNA